MSAIDIYYLNESETDSETETEYETESESEDEFVDVVENAPEPMLIPAFMDDIELKSRAQIVAILRRLSDRERLELVMYMYMNTEHYRVNNDDEYNGANEIFYNRMTLYGADELIDQMFADKVAVFKQAPERSGKTLQMMLDVLLGYHRNYRGIIGIGSPKDNVDSVTADLNAAQERFKKFVERKYRKTNAAFKDVFDGANIYGPQFKFYDGSMTRKEFTELAQFVSGGKVVPVFSATALPPLKSMFKVLTHLREQNLPHFILFDEADAVVKPLTTKSDKMKTIIENIFGMRGNIVKTCDCGHTHICGSHAGDNSTIGTYGSAAKIMLLSATMNLATEFFKTRGNNDEAMMVMRPYANRAIKLRGGVNDHNKLTDTAEMSAIELMLNDYLNGTNETFDEQIIPDTDKTTTCTLRHQYVLDNAAGRESSDERMTGIISIVMMD